MFAGSRPTLASHNSASHVRYSTPHTLHGSTMGESNAPPTCRRGRGGGGGEAVVGLIHVPLGGEAKAAPPACRQAGR